MSPLLVPAPIPCCSEVQRQKGLVLWNQASNHQGQWWKWSPDSPWAKGPSPFAVKIPFYPQHSTWTEVSCLKAPSMRISLYYWQGKTGDLHWGQNTVWTKADFRKWQWLNQGFFFRDFPANDANGFSEILSYWPKFLELWAKFWNFV